jgi:hypothetical protein
MLGRREGIKKSINQFKRVKMKDKRESFKLVLASWQSRMVQDFLNYEKPVESVTINPGVIQCPASYKIPVDGLSWRDWVLYLTNEQMEIVQKHFRLDTPITGINITDSLIKKGEITFEMVTSFKLELDSWQSRIVQDFLNLERSVDVMTIKPGVIQCPASYKIPVKGLSRRDWVLHLTDNQMDIVQKQFGLKLPISAINITDRLIDKGEIAFN